MFKIGSLFDGSGGFPLAASLCGGVPVWASEVEPYPIAVTRSRFPNMKHLGSVTEINGAKVDPVDVITFGSPCQDLSVAGKRAGLKHEDNGDEETTRSGLFMEAVRIIKEMREATNGVYPTFAVWENVPGAFSSNRGEDFRTVLEELVKIAEPEAVMPAVPQGGWAYADSYCGDGWSIAYRVFDAQYWGVPQRRRRIYLVAGFRGQCAGKVLFERKGLRRDSETSRETREETAGDAESGIGTADREGNGIINLNKGDVQSKAVLDPAGIAPSLYAGECRGGGGECYVMDKKCCGTSPTYCLQGSMIGRSDKNGPQGDGVNEEVAFTCNTIDRHAVAYGISSYASNAMKSSNPNSGIYEATTSRTLDLNGGNPACNQGGIMVVEPVTYDGSTVTSPYNVQNPQPGDPCHTLGTDNRNYVVYALDQQGGKGGANRMGTGGGNVPMVMENKAYLASGKETIGTLMANAGTKLRLGNQEAFSGDYHIVEEKAEVYRQGGFAEYIEGEVGTLRAAGGDLGGGSENLVATQYIVRRLTPTECARLQGFADRWGDIDPKEDFTEEEYRFWLDVRNTHATINGKAVKEYTKAQMVTWYNKLNSDSNEYKMWGNGIALPCALYVMQGIAERMKEE